MHALRSIVLLPLLLIALLASPIALAERPYLVEVIVFRQPGESTPAARTAPEDWAAGAQGIAGQERPTSLDDEASKLNPGNGYQVLLHKAWAQPIGERFGRVALSTGDERFGHSPVEGTLGLKQDRFIDLEADFWVNQFDDDGLLSGSQRLKQATRLKTDELNYLDHGGLGLLIRVSAQ